MSLNLNDDVREAIKQTENIRNEHNKVPLYNKPNIRRYKPLVKQKHKHKWVFQRSDYSKRIANDILIEYRRIDTYYCENCLEIKEIIAKEEIFPNAKEYKNNPYWFNPIIRIQRF